MLWYHGLSDYFLLLSHRRKAGNQASEVTTSKLIIRSSHASSHLLPLELIGISPEHINNILVQLLVSIYNLRHQYRKYPPHLGYQPAASY